MTAQKYSVALEQSEVQQLENITRKGVNSTRVVTRARVLLMANENGPAKTDIEIRQALNLASSTPHDIRKRYVDGGLERALYDAPRPGKPKTFTPKDEALVVAVACTKPDDGHSRWTLNLLTEKAIPKLGKSIGRSTIHRILLQNDLKPWREKNVVYS